MSPEPGQRMTRRQAIVLIGAGVASAATGATGLVQGWGSPTRRAHEGSSGATGRELVEPEVIDSEDGSLEATLTAAAGRVNSPGGRSNALSYNGSVPGPRWRIRPGDRVRLDLDNRLGAGTNLHVHGLHVSPEDNGDNAFLHIDDGETFQYEYAVPQDHPAGTF